MHLTTGEVERFINDYIGVDGGNLLGFTRQSLRAFLSQDCGFSNPYGRQAGQSITKRQELLDAMRQADGLMQAQIVEQAIARLPVQQADAPKTRTEELREMYLLRASELREGSRAADELAIRELDQLLAATTRLLVVDGQLKAAQVLAEGVPLLTRGSSSGWFRKQPSITLLVSPMLLGPIRETEPKSARLPDVEFHRPELAWAWLIADAIGSVEGHESVLGGHEVTVDFRVARKNSSEWREGARKFFRGKGVTNQGRVRSDNVAALAHEGLLFRSQPEIRLYDELKRIGVMFAPLPVFLHGGKTYQRLEPDFVLVHRGLLMIVEVDGDLYHSEKPSEASRRLRRLREEGVHVERVNASECSHDKVSATAEQLVATLDRLKDSR